MLVHQRVFAMQDEHLGKILPEKRQVHRWIHQSCHDVWSAIRMRWAGRVLERCSTQKKLSGIGSCSHLRHWKIYDLKLYATCKTQSCAMWSSVGKQKKNNYTATCFVGVWSNPSTFVWSRSWQITYKELWGPHKMTETKWVTRVITLLLGGYNSHL